MPIIGAKGSPSSGGFGQFAQASAVPNYIEDVFSTWLYTGNGSTQTINNGIDLAGKGGMVWGKNRSANWDHYLADTAQGIGKFLSSNTTSATQLDSTSVTAFNSNGFSIGNAGSSFNDSGNTYASWTFREQPKFFDVVTYTGDGSSGQAISHNLGSIPGCIIIKCTSDSGTDWIVHHRSVSGNYLTLNTTSAQAATGFGDPATASVFYPFFTRGSTGPVNSNGLTYVAYLFAHNAGGFGLTGTDNVISCGSYTGNGSSTGPSINLGYEPQWVMIKNASATGGWVMADNMRGLVVGGDDPYVMAQSANAEDTAFNFISPTATGFNITTSNTAINGSGNTVIYIAIRRGPMRTPTTGTSVFAPNAVTAATGSTVTTNFPVDLNMVSRRTTSGGTPGFNVADRLRGLSSTDTVSFAYLLTYATSAEGSIYGQIRNADNTGFKVTGDFANEPVIYYSFKRAPGFFDEVCYTGNSVAGRQVTHNLTVAPELLIVKRRTGGVDSWYCYAQPLGNTFDILLDSTRAASSGDEVWFNTSPTSTNFTVRQYDAVNGSGSTYVAYLFASCPGVSKVTNFTGTGTLQTINCGFTGGARFVLIKRTDSTGNWFVWDSSRGLSSSNDPYLMLNSTAAEVTSTNWVDTTATGFQVTAASGNDVNINGASYIALAIA